MQEMHRPFLPFSTNFKILNFFLSSNITNNIFQLVTLLNRFHIFFSLFSSFPVYYPFSDRGSFRPAFNNPSPACLNNGKAPVCGLVYGRFAEHASHTSTERDVRLWPFYFTGAFPSPPQNAELRPRPQLSVCRGTRSALRSRLGLEHI